MEGEARSRREDETVERVWFVASTPFLPLGVCFFLVFPLFIRFSLFYPLALDFAWACLVLNFFLIYRNNFVCI